LHPDCLAWRATSRLNPKKSTGITTSGFASWRTGRMVSFISRTKKGSFLAGSQNPTTQSSTIFFRNRSAVF